jgi:hypothetical protein
LMFKTSSKIYNKYTSRVITHEESH